MGYFMNIVFLSPNFPPNWFNFCRALKAEGATVLAIADCSYDELRQEIKENIDDYYQVSNMLDHDSMVRALGYFTFRHGHIDRVESLTEHWLGIEAYLRKMFNVFGPTMEEQAEHRSKMGMKRIFQKNNIPCSPGYKVNNLEDVESHLDELGLPIVLKPDTGVGAQATYKITSREQLRQIAAYGLDNYIMEPFVKGNIVTFDGLTDRDGNIIFKTSHEYADGIMEVVTEMLPVHFWSVREINPRLEAIGRQIVAAFKLKQRFFHIEFFKLAPDQYQVLEINLRPPGGYMIDMMNYSADTDLYATWAKVVTGHEVETITERKYNVAHSSRRYHLNYVLSDDALWPQIKDHVVYASEMPPIFSAAMGDYVFLLRHEDSAELQKLIALIDKRIG